MSKWCQSFGRLNDMVYLKSKDQKSCQKQCKGTLNILQETTVNKSRQWSVCLLWNSDKVLLKNNKNIALSQVFSLERKFANNPQLAKRYKEAMKDCISKGPAVNLNQMDSETTSRSQ